MSKELPLIKGSMALPAHVIKFPAGSKPVVFSAMPQPLYLNRRRPPRDIMEEEEEAETVTSTRRQKRSHEVMQMDEEVQRIKAEESLPWVLGGETDENVYVGSLESQMSDYVILSLMEGAFKVIPVDSWYKFSYQPKLQPVTKEELDAIEKDKKRTKTPWTKEIKVKKETKKDKITLDEIDFDPREGFEDDEEDVFGDLNEEREGQKKEYEKQFSSGAAGIVESDEEDELTEEGKTMRKALSQFDKSLYDSEDEEYDEVFSKKKLEKKITTEEVVELIKTQKTTTEQLTQILGKNRVSENKAKFKEIVKQVAKRKKDGTLVLK